MVTALPEASSEKAGLQPVSFASGLNTAWTWAFPQTSRSGGFCSLEPASPTTVPTASSDTLEPV